TGRGQGGRGLLRGLPPDRPALHHLARLRRGDLRGRGGARQPAPKVTAITTAEYPTRASRPANLRLDCSRAAAVLGIPAADWRAGLDRRLDALLSPRKDPTP
ncbi:sugar nucleotide-binding protein, partial [Paeniroseomonas aquatica]|uniref:sugar nucleotide-binding protein n=1 Tax=Paeniroseomonas aquatica TaxID=373043 RepID=UPI003624339D